MKNATQEKLAAEIETFKTTRQTIQISTLNDQQKPNVSYAPFVQVGECFYILISQLARHTQNLQSTPHASVMLIDDENEASNVFARRRLTYAAEAKAVTRDSTIWQAALNRFEQRFGKFIRELESFKDFHLFELNLKEGLYVKGFGQAYSLSGNTLADLSHRVDGHEQNAKKSA